MSGGQQQERPRLTTPSTASRARKNAARYSVRLSGHLDAKDGSKEKCVRGIEMSTVADSGWGSYWPAIGEWLSTTPVVDRRVYRKAFIRRRMRRSGGGLY
ncbi:conserved hypothetical protein [Coccidioides posadasii str. Silveira]|uniref:Uncharacterized protein n=1 Tax=Coccidioides posadasii (strain RMSCC 757 / Silveira) TaxID=443226 RepID=E9DBV0_COCPS|nr:conserved hypothetical protein [Coccidioides posadasii str. Silveira]